MYSISKLLNPNLIVLNLDVDNKIEAISYLCELIEKNNKCDHEQIYNSIITRENLHSTAIGNGIAIPHARCDVNNFILACGISKKGINFNSHDNQPVNIVFLIIAPKKETSTYLQILSQIATLLNNEQIKNELINCNNSTEFIKLIENYERR